MSPSPILIVEDQPRVAKALRLLLDLHDLPSLTAQNPDEALAIIDQQEISVVLQDMNFSPGVSTGEEGIQLFQEIRRIRPGLPILLLTAWASVEDAVRLMRNGAADYLEKPWDDAKLVERVEDLLVDQRSSQPSVGTHRDQLRSHYDLGELIYSSRQMHEVVTLALKIARADVPVLITGPNGSGKERIAELVQRNSPRREGPFVRVNVGALPDSLLEAELFGNEAGAFTGAERRQGRFEAANGGTLLLDEIGNLSASGQAKLLRVLQTGEFERLGSSSSRRADVRVLAATNTDLPEAITAGLFREDLYFRLNVIELAVPSLADRPDDILPLAEHFMGQLTPQGQGPMRLSEATRRALLDHPWPGNVRELRNCIQRGVLVAIGHVLQPADVGLAESASRPSRPRAQQGSAPSRSSEKERVENALVAAEGVVARAAEMLGISRQALYRRMDRLGIVLERRPRDAEAESP
ncbi:MAG: sigma-54 dependent transcriptional regulator [Thermoanaerobaculia bacterium]|nr:sigma-54 dependent transcriptional regulator [Thermoanaerobaculia bacterium]